VVAGSALLSTALELGQIYIAARTPSWSDVFAQTLGALVGVTLWNGVGNALLQAVARPVQARSATERGHAMLGLYAAGWMGLRALPLVFPRFAHPLLEHWRSRLEFSPLLLVGPFLVHALAAVPLGVLLALFTARLRGIRRVLSIVAGTALVTSADAVRQVQLLPTDGHLAAALAGLALGWVVASPAGARLRAWSRVRASGAALTGLAMTTALLVVHYWAPFNFGVRPRALDARIRILYERAPFHRYYWTPPLIAVGEALTLALLGGLFSLLLAFWRPAGRRLPAGLRVAITAATFVAIEWGQLYLPGRRADPTDVMIAALGASIGALAARGLEESAPPLQGGS
jgi:VanZ family protein